jgi:hypothetical protein
MKAFCFTTQQAKTIFLFSYFQYPNIRSMDLPEDLMREILNELNPLDICALGRVNRTWRRVSTDPLRWKRICLFNEEVYISEEEVERWESLGRHPKELYIQKYKIEHNIRKGFNEIKPLFSLQEEDVEEFVGLEAVCYPYILVRS